MYLASLSLMPAGGGVQKAHIFGIVSAKPQGGAFMDIAYIGLKTTPRGRDGDSEWINWGSEDSPRVRSQELWERA